MIRYLWHRFLCEFKGWHDTGLRRTGRCRRCGGWVFADGTTRR